MGNVKPIRHPHPSSELAEFTGILLGDGGLTKYQLTITLHNSDDKEYSYFVARLIEKLFDVTPSVYHKIKFSAVNLVVSRRKLIIFCNKKLGINIGNKIKQKIDIPNWIKNNNKFSQACMRGLFDTDGSVVRHRYSVNGKEYCYKKLEFCSISRPLRESAYTILSDLKMNPRIAREKKVFG